MYEYDCEILRVKDGDTLEVMLDLGCSIHSKQSIRLIGFDAAEKNDPSGAGPKAKALTENLLAQVRVQKGFKTFRIKTKKDAKSFERYLGELFAVVDSSVDPLNQSLYEALKNQGLLRPGSKWNPVSSPSS